MGLGKNLNKTNNVLCFFLFVLVLALSTPMVFAATTQSFNLSVSITNIAPNITFFEPSGLIQTNGSINFNVSFEDRNSDNLTWNYTVNSALFGFVLEKSGTVIDNSTQIFNFVRPAGTYEVVFFVSDAVENQSIQWNVTVNSTGSGVTIIVGGPMGPVAEENVTANITTLPLPLEPEESFLDLLFSLGSRISPSIPLLGWILITGLLWLAISNRNWFLLGKRRRKDKLDKIRRKRGIMLSAIDEERDGRKKRGIVKSAIDEERDGRKKRGVVQAAIE